MREAQFNAELIQSLRYWGAWAYKIQDLPASMTMGLRYVPEKPCDVVGAYRGRFFAIESKQAKAFEAFGMRQMRPAQVKHLNEIVDTGSKAFVFLNIRIPAIKRKKLKSGKIVKQARVNRLIVFDWVTFRALGERSMKKKEIMELPYLSYQNVKKDQHDKQGQIIYDLKHFLGSL